MKTIIGCIHSINTPTKATMAPSPIAQNIDELMLLLGVSFSLYFDGKAYIYGKYGENIAPMRIEDPNIMNTYYSVKQTPIEAAHTITHANDRLIKDFVVSGFQNIKINRKIVRNIPYIEIDNAAVYLGIMLSIVEKEGIHTRYVKVKAGYIINSR